ncbi:MAG: hypothetical protein EBV80_05485, partial [Acidimicrobiia bacterium]|nr:hypothetical protein [Acidimicrobiia bacterium]
LFLLTFQRSFDAKFFDVAAGADPLLWQHLFWIFGHPEVYILVLPSFGIISEVLPVFSRKPLFGYPFVVFSGAAIGFVGWGVWAHHMFASGLGPVSVAVFSLATMAIAVPTGVKIINWTLTMWGGKLVFTTAMKFAVGLIILFTIGGLSGVTHSVAPSDTQQTDVLEPRRLSRLDHPHAWCVVLPHQHCGHCPQQGARPARSVECPQPRMDDL